ncbi:MAG TPA: NAD(P)-binding protein [Spirochaetota bacterium]|nr:NAD(P)-binding protein [Spirochaetota bacterium]
MKETKTGKLKNDAAEPSASGKQPSSKSSSIKEKFNLRFFSPKDSSPWAGDKKNIVVIGSGIGGMASAALFAKIGHHVSVLEMNDSQIGGHGRCLTLDGMKYSMGPQYVWEFNEGERGDRFLKFLGIKSSNPFLLMERDGFERVFIGSRNDYENNSYFLNFRVPLGLDNFRKELSAMFPEESDNINSLFRDMTAIFNTYKSFFSRQNDSDSYIFLAAKFLLSNEANFSLKMKMAQVLFLSVKEWFDQYKISSLPRRILYGHGGIFAESESEMSALAYIIGTGNYHKGARYPEKGFHFFFESLVSSIRANGGTVETGKKVVQLVTKNNIVTSAVCNDGTVYPCDVVFSDISPRLTYSLLGKSIASFKYLPSHSIPTVCIGLKKGLEPIAAMKGRNYWWQDGKEVNYNNPDITAPPKMLFVCSPTANKYGAAAKKNKDALVVFCPGNYNQENKIYAKGPGAVSAFKQKLATDIVEILDRNMFPGLKSKLLFTEVVSSIDIKAQTNGEMGNAYGRRLSVKEILKGQIEENGCPKNLYNVSATKNSPGIAGGIGTASALFEELTGNTI